MLCIYVTVDVYNQGISIFPEIFSEYVYYLNGPANIHIHWNFQGIYKLTEKKATFLYAFTEIYKNKIKYINRHIFR